MFRLRYVTILVFTLAPLLVAQCSCDTPIGDPPGPIAGSGGGDGWVWDYTTCSWVLVCDPSDPTCGTPIVIDTDGSGFQLTSAANGVMFDFYGTGTPIRIAWTAKGSTNGWLALPKHGQITSARDLFGNITPQFLTPSHPANGFAALGVYDLPSHGGNNNGVIDPGDAIFPSLRVWIDANHDGIAQPTELHTLDDVGIARIPLQYAPSPLVDPYGNQFRFRGHLIRRVAKP